MTCCPARVSRCLSRARKAQDPDRQGSQVLDRCSAVVAPWIHAPPRSLASGGSPNTLPGSALNPEGFQSSQWGVFSFRSSLLGGPPTFPSLCHWKVTKVSPSPLPAQPHPGLVALRTVRPPPPPVHPLLSRPCQAPANCPCVPSLLTRTVLPTSPCSKTSLFHENCHLRKTSGPSPTILTSLSLQPPCAGLLVLTIPQGAEALGGQPRGIPTLTRLPAPGGQPGGLHKPTLHLLTGLVHDPALMSFQRYGLEAWSGNKGRHGGVCVLVHHARDRTGRHGPAERRAARGTRSCPVCPEKAFKQKREVSFVTGRFLSTQPSLVG